MDFVVGVLMGLAAGFGLGLAYGDKVKEKWAALVEQLKLK